MNPGATGSEEGLSTGMVGDSNLNPDEAGTDCVEFEETRPPPVEANVKVVEADEL